MNAFPQQVGMGEGVGRVDKQVPCSPRKKQKTNSIVKVGIPCKGLSDSTGAKKGADESSVESCFPNKRKSDDKEVRVDGTERSDLEDVEIIDLTEVVDFNYPDHSHWDSTANLKTEPYITEREDSVVGNGDDNPVYLGCVSPDYTTSHGSSTSNGTSPYNKARGCIPAKNRGFVDGNDKNPVDLLLSDDDSSHGGCTAINRKSQDSKAHGTPLEPEVLVSDKSDEGRPVDSISVDMSAYKHSSDDSSHTDSTSTDFLDKGERKSDSNPTENPSNTGCAETENPSDDASAETSNRNDNRSDDKNTEQEESRQDGTGEINDGLCDEESQENSRNGAENDPDDGLFQDEEEDVATDKGENSDPDGLFAEGDDQSEHSTDDGLFSEESDSGTVESDSDPDGLFNDEEEDVALEHHDSNAFLGDNGDDEDGYVLRGDTSSLPTLSFPDRTPQRRNVTLPKDAVLYGGPDVTVFLIERKNDQYFLKWTFGERLIIQIIPLADATSKIPKELVLAGSKCSLIAVKLIENKGGNSCAPGRQKFATTSAKAFYVAHEGPGYETMDLEHELNKLANFSSLENPGKIASRLELMVSPAAWAPSKKFAYQFALNASDFEEIAEQGNDGCGFFPETFFDDRLGITDPRSVCAHQVRIYAPKLGYFKGMIVRKRGITKIQLPPSMKKVDKSTLKEESPDWAILMIRAVFPSQSCKMVERSINPNLKCPPESSTKDLKRLQEERMTWNLFVANGVPKDALETYAYESKTWEGRKEAPCVGVADPTGWLPADFVFVSGLGTVSGDQRQSMMYSQLFVTRTPCTEKKDGMLLRNVRSKPNDMPQASWDFLCSMPFGVLVFSNFSKHDSKSLPEQVNDGDLDGDLYTCYWDEKLLDWISNAKAAVIPEQDTQVKSKCSGNALKAASRKKAGLSSAASNRGWFAKVQDYLADVNQLRMYDRLTKKLYSAYTKAQKEASYDPDDETTLILSQCFKNSIDLRKHGGKVGLPADLWGRVNEKALHKFL
jgi:hypothetical protein